MNYDLDSEDLEFLLRNLYEFLPRFHLYSLDETWNNFFSLPKDQFEVAFLKYPALICYLRGYLSGNLTENFMWKAPDEFYVTLGPYWKDGPLNESNSRQNSDPPESPLKCLENALTSDDMWWLSVYDLIDADSLEEIELMLAWDELYKINPERFKVCMKALTMNLSSSSCDFPLEDDGLHFFYDAEWEAYFEKHNAADTEPLIFLLSAYGLNLEHEPLAYLCSKAGSEVTSKLSSEIQQKGMIASAHYNGDIIGESQEVLTTVFENILKDLKEQPSGDLRKDSFKILELKSTKKLPNFSVRSTFRADYRGIRVNSILDNLGKFFEYYKEEFRTGADPRIMFQTGSLAPYLDDSKFLDEMSDKHPNEGLFKIQGTLVERAPKYADFILDNEERLPVEKLEDYLRTNLNPSKSPEYVIKITAGGRPSIFTKGVYINFLLNELEWTPRLLEEYWDSRNRVGFGFFAFDLDNEILRKGTYTPLLKNKIRLYYKRGLLGHVKVFADKDLFWIAEDPEVKKKASILF